MVKNKRNLLLNLTVIFGILLASNDHMLHVHAEAKANDSPIQYTIKKGDTFYLLGKRFNSSVEDISSMNPKIDSLNLRIGSKIKLPVGSGVEIHRVKKGDTLGNIARNYNSTVDMIAKKNYIVNPNIIYPRNILAITKINKELLQVAGTWKSTNKTRLHFTEVNITPTGYDTFNIGFFAINITTTYNGYEVYHDGSMSGKGKIVNGKIEFIIDKNMSGEISLQNGKLLINYLGPRNYQAGITVYYDTEFVRESS